jgi:uncharacterized protein (DUF1778 family)
MELMQRKVDQLEQNIATNEERLLKETDSLQRQSLKEFIDRETAALNILRLEQEIKINKERLLNEGNSLRRQSLNEFIDRDTATLRGLYHKIAPQPAPSKC